MGSKIDIASQPIWWMIIIEEAKRESTIVWNLVRGRSSWMQPRSSIWLCWMKRNWWIGSAKFAIGHQMANDCGRIIVKCWSRGLRTMTGWHGRRKWRPWI